MKLLEERITTEGIVEDGSVLKVGSFLNHQCDVELFDAMGKEWAKRFSGLRVDKILTIESSGIGIACVAARHFKNAPVVFAKKSPSINLTGDQFCTTVHSFTHNTDNTVIVSKRLLTPHTNVLIIDDFLANGCALQGLLTLCKQAQVNVVGIGIAIEKGFQPGGATLRELGYRVESLAIIDKIDPQTKSIHFRSNYEILDRNFSYTRTKI